MLGSEFGEKREPSGSLLVDSLVVEVGSVGFVSLAEDKVTVDVAEDKDDDKAGI
jgi:hypothetical protein